MANPFGIYNNERQGQQGRNPYGGFYDPDSGSQFDYGYANPFLQSPQARQSYYNSNPFAAFGAYQNSLPGGLGNPYANWLQRNYYSLNSRFGDYQLSHPYSSFTDYLSANANNLQSEFSNLSPTQRGETPQLAGRTQYVGF